jgi:hypothetical protein
MGTSNTPVILESADEGAGPGAWLGLRLDAEVTSDTTLTRAVIRRGGEAAQGQRGCVTINSDAADRVSIDSSRFEDCAQAAVVADRDGFGFGSFNGNTFVNSDAGLRLHPGAVGTVDANQTYESTPSNLILGGELSQSATWERQPVPWELEASVEVRSDAGPVLTIAPGNTLRLPTNTWIRVGGGSPGGLVAAGTEQLPIVYEARDTGGGPGSWLGLRVAVDTLSGTALTNVVVRQAGQENFGQKGAITIDAPGDNVAITDSTFEQNLAYDVWFDCDDPPLLEGNTYDAGVPECPRM